MDQERLHIATLCAHAGSTTPESETLPAVLPIYQTSVYEFPDLETVDEVSEGQRPGFIYGRYGLPNHRALESIAAKLERGEAAIASSSGMASLLLALWVFAREGGELLVAGDAYGGTLSLAAREIPRLGVATRFVSSANPAALESAFSPRTQVLLVETLSNPLWNVVDVEAVAALCREKNVRLVVDNTVATPYLVRPLLLGADAVVHSATKFLGGHHDLTAGILIGSSDLIARARESAIRLGVVLSPFDAWLAVRGIKTFALRMSRICSNALTVARFLEDHPAVVRVYYPGLESHPQNEIIKRTMNGLGGGMVSFELKGDVDSAGRFVRRLKLIRFAPSLGGVTTTISHPAKTSHRSLTPAQRREIGISDAVLRLSIGIEEPEDLVEELQRVLEEA
jgi:cystathionine gamma-synthase/methionine-gamma-lyase